MSDQIAPQDDNNSLLRRCVYWLQTLVTTGVTINPGDIEIGAVEIKNGASDQRAVVNAAGELATTAFNPTVTAVFGSVNTAATGTNYTTLTAGACTAVTVVNNSGTDLQLLRNAAGTAFPLLNGTSKTFRGITNANQLSVRRIDTSNTQVAVPFETEAYS